MIIQYAVSLLMHNNGNRYLKIGNNPNPDWFLPKLTKQQPVKGLLQNISKERNKS